MELDLGIEVSEVNFEEFERRKYFRGNDVFSEIQRNVYFANEFFENERIDYEDHKGIIDVSLLYKQWK